MNGKDLLDKMSDVDPKLIEEADEKPRRSRNWFIGITTGAAATAAAALIAVAIGYNVAQEPPVIDTSNPANSGTVTSDIVSSGTASTQPPVVDLTPKDPPVLDFSKYKDLPKITSGDYAVTGNGGGEILGEKGCVKVQKDYLDYSDLEQLSPWKGAVLETMPVYMSHSTDLNFFDIDKMYVRAREVAAALGIPEDSIKFTDNYQDMTKAIEEQRRLGKEHGATDEEIEEVINRMVRGVMSMTNVDGENEDISISVDAAFSAYVNFKGSTGSMKLPEGYNFTISATDEEKAALVNYFADKYKGILNFSKPAFKEIFSDSSDNIYFYIYDNDGDLTQQIVNYWLNSACFNEHHENAGELSRMWFNTDDNCEKLGDYPILTAEQAEAILKSNKFDDKMRMPADAKILKTDMVYKNSAGCTAVMPYYEFYVGTDDKTYFNKDITCNVYTIPAVPEEFIDMETDDYGVYA